MSQAFVEAEFPKASREYLLSVTYVSKARIHKGFTRHSYGTTDVLAPLEQKFVCRREP